MSHDPFAAQMPARRRIDEPLWTRPAAEQIRVECIFHKYPPQHGAGAEWMAHTLLRDLAARGHIVKVWVNKVGGDYELDGVDVGRWRGPEQVRNADVILTHLDLTRYAAVAGAHLRVSVVHLLHNDNQLQYHRVGRSQAQLCIANSQWIRDMYGRSAKYGSWPMAVIHPPVEPEQYTVTGFIDDRITLMNLSEAKGGPLFWDLARALPHRKFLAVRGAYAQQIIPGETVTGTIPDNVLLIPNTPDVVSQIYARTKVLLVPSSYESWGRVAVEAACSGIPMICHATPGLTESMGSTAIWRHRENVGGWIDAIEMLFDDGEHYAERSAAVYARARELDPKLGDFDRFERLLLAVVRGDEDFLQKDLASVTPEVVESSHDDDERPDGHDGAGVPGVAGEPDPGVDRGGAG